MATSIPQPTYPAAIDIVRSPPERTAVGAGGVGRAHSPKAVLLARLRRSPSSFRFWMGT